MNSRKLSDSRSFKYKSSQINTESWMPCAWISLAWEEYHHQSLYRLRGFPIGSGPRFHQISPHGHKYSLTASYPQHFL